jgi:hypothetical protein
MTQAILPASVIPPDGSPNSEITSNPDAHGGFDLGTYATWLPHGWKCSPEHGNQGLAYYHVFTWEDCLKIQDWFKQWKYSHSLDGYMNPNYKTKGFRAEYFPILKALFENKDDLPVYYLAD